MCFFLDFCVFQGLYDGKVLGIGKEKEGLYILKNQIQPSVQAMATSNMSEDATLWHLRLGHASTGILQHIQSLKHFSDKNVQHKCEICPLAKQCRLQFPISERRTLKAFEMIHVDVWGHIRNIPLIRSNILSLLLMTIVDILGYASVTLKVRLL